MKFHLPSFLLGYAAGGVSVAIWRQIRPLAVEVATACYRLADAVAARAVMKREDFEDVLAEARARARGSANASGPAARPTVEPA